MANNYEEYSYEEEYDKKNNGERNSVFKSILMVLLFITLIIFILLIIRSCNSNINKKLVDYEGPLIKAGKEYFKDHSEATPKSVGECNIVTLQTLVNEQYMSLSAYENCDSLETYVRACKLADKSVQYTPWVSCPNYKSNELYGNAKEGTAMDVKEDESYLTFMFKPYKLEGTSQYGDIEEIWKDDIQYKSYKTLATTNYYRYRDQLFTWDVRNRYFYTSKGPESDASKVKEYYASSPNTNYPLSTDRSTEGYKWFEATKEYYMQNGVKAYSNVSPAAGYIYKDAPVTVTKYAVKTVVNSYPAKYYYVCTAPNSSKIYYSLTPCGSVNNPSYNITRGTVYSCVKEENDSVRDNLVNDATCYEYSGWKTLEGTQTCDTKGGTSTTCKSITTTLYAWYKIDENTRRYIPSGKSKWEDENVYYLESPKEGAIKDDTKRNTVYKWYNEKSETTSSFTAIAPTGYSSATRTSNYKYSEWSNWSTTNPKVNDGRVRQIETKTKIKLQQILGDEENYSSLSNDYITELDMINLFKEKGYNVNSLDDINNNGEIKYEVKMFIMNKGER